MPLVNIRVIEGVFSPEQKKELIKRVTDAVVSVEGEALRPMTLTLLEEVKSGDWGVGGMGATTAMVKDIQAGKLKPPS